MTPSGAYRSQSPGYAHSRIALPERNQPACTPLFLPLGTLIDAKVVMSPCSKRRMAALRRLLNGDLALTVPDQKVFGEQ